MATWLYCVGEREHESDTELFCVRTRYFSLARSPYSVVRKPQKHGTLREKLHNFFSGSFRHRVNSLVSPALQFDLKS